MLKYLSQTISGYGNLRKLFFSREGQRSDSDNGHYYATVAYALQNQRSFETFKRNKSYRKILEHVSREQGQAYLDIIQNRNDGLLASAISTVLASDDIGSPLKFIYKIGNVDYRLSPTTLRYVKVASDLNGLFGHGIEKVAEIGCGYGGQCLVNDRLLEYKSAILFDLHFVNELIRRYLNYTIMDGSFEATTINEAQSDSYDLVISNYAFSELPLALQTVYIDKVLSGSSRGYLTMNSGLGGWRDAGKLSLDDLRKMLPEIEIFEEEPKTGSTNYIILWGHDKNFAMKWMKLRSF